VKTIPNSPEVFAFNVQWINERKNPTTLCPHPKDMKRPDPFCLQLNSINYKNRHAATPLELAEIHNPLNAAPDKGLRWSMKAPASCRAQT
jgi:hypothetical protein